MEAGRHARPRGKRVLWMAGLPLIAAALVAAIAIAADSADPAPASAGPSQASQRAATSASPTPSSRPSASMWPVASTVADLSAPLAGMPPVADPANIYADDGAGMLSPAVRGVPYRIYVPNSGGSTVTVIDPATYRVIEHATRRGSTRSTSCRPTTWRMLWVVEPGLGLHPHPHRPRHGRPAGAPVPVADPYNMYFTPDGALRLSWWRNASSVCTSATRTPWRCTTSVRGGMRGDRSRGVHGRRALRRSRRASSPASCSSSTSLTHKVLAHPAAASSVGHAMPQDVGLDRPRTGASSTSPT